MSVTAPIAAPDFDEVLGANGLPELRRQGLATLQVNLGKLCNQACHHCHVEAGPKRTEIMTRRTLERLDELVAASPDIDVVDLTGGAPELNPEFRWFVGRMRERGHRVIARCNLTVIFVEGQSDLPNFYSDQGVELVCSLPCYTAENVDQQRGKGVFQQSIDALKILNGKGYAMPGSSLSLDLVYNPGGAFLPPPQEELENKYREELRALFGIEFGRLLTITNMPIKRFAEQLQRWGDYQAYMELLVNHFNPSAVEDVMCRSMVSVGWDGVLYDCDFNQMLEIGAAGLEDRSTIWDIETFEDLVGSNIATAPHCFGCTAGAGSSCGGALA